MQKMSKVDLLFSYLYFSEHVDNLKSEYNFIKMIIITDNKVPGSITFVNHNYPHQNRPGIVVTYVQKMRKVYLSLSRLYFPEHVDNLKNWI